jgi:purine-binding chemotaxis protein CheW
MCCNRRTLVSVHTGSENGEAFRRHFAQKTGKPVQLVVFRLGDQRYALPLAAVERIVRAAEVTRLPDAPPIVLGVLDVQGRIFPVLDIRRRFGQPPREINPADQFLIARTAARTVILVVDETEGVIDCSSDEIVSLARIAPGAELFPGMIRLSDGLILIHDLERFLSADEARELDEAMRRESS